MEEKAQGPLRRSRTGGCSRDFRGDLRGIKFQGTFRKRLGRKIQGKGIGKCKCGSAKPIVWEMEVGELRATQTGTEEVGGGGGGFYRVNNFEDAPRSKIQLAALEN